MKLIRYKDYREYSAGQLAAHYKFLGLSKHRAFDQFIIDNGLVFSINAKDFYKLYQEAIPKKLWEEEEVDIEMTHLDCRFSPPVRCHIELINENMVSIIWENGYNGTHFMNDWEFWRHIKKIGDK